MDFADALTNLKTGFRIARKGWNGKGMWLVLVKYWSGNIGGDAPADWEGYLPFIAMFTADKKVVPWLASQTDILATDWEVVV